MIDAGGAAAQAWVERAHECGRALEAAVARADWAAATALIAEITTLLRTPSRTAGAPLSPVYAHTRDIIARATASVSAARDDTATKLKQLSKGRKAVSAYG